MFKYLLKVSRPRFWHYIFGPFVIGSLIAFEGDFVQLFLTDNFWFWLIYFLFPANFLIYGINDLGDQDTDQLNPKKNSYEVKFENNKMIIFVVLFLLSTLPALFFINSIWQGFALALFWFFSIFYSIEPIRAKASPIIDSLFNILYVMPGIFGYLYFFADANFIDLNIFIVLAATFWCMAMHSFSAIPDIEADKSAGLLTTAVLLNNRGASFYCFVLFLCSGILTLKFLNFSVIVLVIPYLMAMILNYSVDNPEFSFKLYKYFPSYNLLVGLLIFWLIVWEFKIEMMM
jgi:lycopene elongase/hydratase (dihydrobisanhydrobacterioruberin-forming)